MGRSKHFIDELVDAFDDDSILGARKVEPPFADLHASRGLRVKYDVRGAENAPKLLYIPGATDDLRKSLSMLQFESLAGRFRTITCDLRNQGETAPFTVDEYIPLETYVDDLLALVDHAFGVNVSFHVIGWGFGAALALLMARLHPERLISMAILAGGYWEEQDSHVGSILPGDASLFGEDWKWIETVRAYATLGTQERCERMLCHADVRRTNEAFRSSMVPSFDWHLRNFVRSEDLTVMCRAAELGQGVLLKYVALFSEGTRNVADISTPTIVVHGRHDGMHSVSRADMLRRRMRNAMLVVLENEGHVLVNAAVGIVSSFMLPEKAYLPHIPALSIDRAMAALDEISAACRRRSFKSKLDAINQELGTTRHEKRIRYHDVFVDVHKSVFEQYGLVFAIESSMGDAQPCRIADLMSRQLAALEEKVVAELDDQHDFQNLTSLQFVCKQETCIEQKTIIGIRCLSKKADDYMALKYGAPWHDLCHQPVRCQRTEK